MTRQEAFEKLSEHRAKHENCIALFRVGDYYEAYEMDAIELNRSAGLVSAISQDIGEHVSGFPHHALDYYLPKLVRAGNRVAIYE